MGLRAAEYTEPRFVAFVGTSSHRSVEFKCSPVKLDRARLSCSSDFPGPAELGAVMPWSFSEEAAAEKYMAQLQHGL
jgi:hypothetical protein